MPPKGRFSSIAKTVKILGKGDIHHIGSGLSSLSVSTDHSSTPSIKSGRAYRAGEGDAVARRIFGDDIEIEEISIEYPIDIFPYVKNEATINNYIDNELDKILIDTLSDATIILIHPNTFYCCYQTDSATRERPFTYKGVQIYTSYDVSEDEIIVK